MVLDSKRLINFDRCSKEPRKPFFQQQQNKHTNKWYESSINSGLFNYENQQTSIECPGQF